MCGQDKCVERPKTNLRCFSLDIAKLSRWCLSLDPGTHSFNSLVAYQAPGAILSPPYAGTGITNTVNTFIFLTWVTRALWAGHPPHLPLRCDPGLFDRKDILCIPKGCRLPRKPHPHCSALYEPTNLYLSLGSVQAQHFLKGFLGLPSEETLLFFLSTTTLDTHFLLMSPSSSLQILILTYDPL